MLEKGPETEPELAPELTRLLVAVLADDAMVLNGVRPSLSNRNLPIPVSQQLSECSQQKSRSLLVTF